MSRIVNAYIKKVDEPNPFMVTAFKKINHCIQPHGICLSSWRWNANVNYNSYQTLTNRIFCVIAIETIFNKN